MQTFFPLPPSIGGTSMAPSNEQEREAYHNIAAISQLAGTTHMTTGVTSSKHPQMEDDVITEAPRLRTDHPRVVSHAEPPVVTNMTGTDVGLHIQPTETSSSGRVLTGMGAEGWTEISTIRGNLIMEFTDPLDLRGDDPLQTDRYRMFTQTFIYHLMDILELVRYFMQILS